jgi:hypothetical protein
MGTLATGVTRFHAKPAIVQASSRVSRVQAIRENVSLGCPRISPKDRVEALRAFQEEDVVQGAKGADPALPPRAQGGKSVQQTLFTWMWLGGAPSGRG